MRKKFNILCFSMVAVIILYFAGTFAYSGIVTYKIATNAMSLSKENAAEKKKNLEIFDNSKYTMCALTMVPTDVLTGEKESTMENTVTGEQTTIMPVKSLVFVKGADTFTMKNTVMSVMGLTGAIAYIFFLYYLVRFIINIRRDKIFEWNNVRMLRGMGISVTVAFVIEVASQWMQYAMALSIFSPKGYMVDWFSGVSGNILLLGLGIALLIIAEVFARGLQMREEQELTI